MAADNKFFETGSNPNYLNLNNTAKDYSNTESTNSPFNLLEILSKHIIITDDSKVVPIQIIEDLLIHESKENK